MTSNYNRRLHRERRSFWSRVSRALDYQFSVDQVVGIVIVACAVVGSLIVWLL